MDRNFAIMLIGAAVLLIGVFILAGGKSDSVDTSFQGNPLEVQANDYVFGEGTEGVTLIEFGDFECPACSQFYTQIKQLEAEFGDEIQLVFRNFPLTSIHPNATAAHRAAVAAGNQGMFFEMHDLLYENQITWSRQTSGLDVGQAAQVFEGYAEELGLNIERFKTDVASEETFNRINTDIDSGTQINVTGTPTLFLNGERISTTPTYEDLRLLVAAKIDEVNQTSDQEATEPAPAN